MAKDPRRVFGVGERAGEIFGRGRGRRRARDYKTQNPSPFPPNLLTLVSLVASSLMPEIQIISQPLMTEGGFINPAGMAELEATISSIPPTHIRLSGDPEWTSLHWIFPHDIVGAFAMWACRQSPYGVPDGLENVCKYLHAALKTVSAWETSGMTQASLCDINRWLHEILMNQGVAEFDAWNERKNKREGTGFSCRFDGPGNPDDDFIDLHALLHNVCITLRGEWRANDAFDKKFEAEHGPLTP